jgi:uncharacterized protein (TIGR03067 family)
MFAISSVSVWGQSGLSEIQGKWREVSRTTEGAAVTTGLGTMSQEAAGKMTTSIEGQVVYVGTARIGTVKIPRNIDYVQTSPGEGQGKIRQGIYEINGETLRICLAPPGVARPKEFEAAQGSQFVLSEYTREKP